jgi:hypothetical protein
MRLSPSTNKSMARRALASPVSARILIADADQSAQQIGRVDVLGGSFGVKFAGFETP